MTEVLHPFFSMILLANCKAVGLIYLVALAGVAIFHLVLKKPKK